jgi:PKD repeat protein
MACRPTGVVQFDSSLRSPGEGATISSYLWDFDDQTPPSSVPNPAHIFLMPGNHAVTLTVTNSFGESDTTNMLITVTP